MRNVGLILLVCIATSCKSQHVVPLHHAHAHNDYEHTRPLSDALDCGFCSIEADIFLVDGKLLVAHKRKEVRPERTLEALYLAPLKQRVRENGGRVYRSGPTLTLMIDFKSPPGEMYPVLRAELERYGDMLTSWPGDRMDQRAVTIVLTGERPQPNDVEGEAVRYVALDGRLDDFQSDVSPALMPRAGIEWKKVLTWNGRGAMPKSERATLRKLVEQSHAKGRELRLWGGPDNVATWTELRAAGVDLINTDDLRGLRDFLLKR